jgi:hypothetical protein
MRKYLLWLSVLLLFTGNADFQSKIEEVINPEQPVSKSICFAVNGDKNYSASIYNDALAQPRIIINKLRADSKIVVWDKTYNSKQLRDYSSVQNTMLEKVIINNIIDSKEKLQVTWLIPKKRKMKKNEKKILLHCFLLLAFMHTKNKITSDRDFYDTCFCIL